jgi:hypothetical protein
MLWLMFGMTTDSNNVQVHSDDDKENKMFAANAPSDPKSTPEDFVTSSPNPEHGSDHEGQQSAFIGAQVDESQQSYLECSRPIYGVNLSHLKEEEQEEGKGDNCASAPKFEELDHATEEALQYRLLLLANNEVDKMSDKKEWCDSSKGL